MRIMGEDGMSKQKTGKKRGVYCQVVYVYLTVIISFAARISSCIIYLGLLTLPVSAKCG